ncbi:hypothetical protein BDB00DRAFT_837650 [Zychaea mexicana]|uniref:uncharacterized protein n=1 Tax=Zychaea mexicana TaxID=64656 RepID=UPI0022FE9869|nr:uncharacterized protein BDB00DRAFT_837650 [Zychaea mexicana]KAI9490554.1 hypothetical protein BDB00DRAFT_837650 [Zychaea mexicana]
MLPNHALTRSIFSSWETCFCCCSSSSSSSSCCSWSAAESTSTSMMMVLLLLSSLSSLWWWPSWPRLRRGRGLSLIAVVTLVTRPPRVVLILVISEVMNLLPVILFTTFMLA